MRQSIGQMRLSAIPSTHHYNRDVGGHRCYLSSEPNHENEVVFTDDDSNMFLVDTSDEDYDDTDEQTTIAFMLLANAGRQVAGQ